METPHSPVESNLFKSQAEFWIPRLGIMVEESRFFELIKSYLKPVCGSLDIVIEETDDSDLKPVNGACWIHYGVKSYIGKFVCGKEVYKFLIVAWIIVIERSHSKKDLVVIDKVFDFGVYKDNKTA